MASSQVEPQQRREQNHAGPPEVHTRSHFFILISRFRIKFVPHTCYCFHGYCKGILNVDDSIISWNDSFGEKEFWPSSYKEWLNDPTGVVTAHVTMEWCIWAVGSSQMASECPLPPSKAKPLSCKCKNWGPKGKWISLSSIESWSLKQD